MSKRKSKPRLFEGLSVRDAKKHMKISVTSGDVKNAKKNDPGNCAAARAGQREYKKDVRVFLTRTYVKENNHWERYLTPESVSREIISFDRGSSFSLGEYVIRPPSGSQLLGNPRGYREHSYAATGKGGFARHRTAHVRPWKA